MTSRPYDEQVKVWAAQRFNVPLDEIDSVAMESVFNEGYACCGGADPNCYCSFAESASMHLSVVVTKVNGRGSVHKIDMMYGDMNELIQEIYEAGQ